MKPCEDCPFTKNGVYLPNFRKEEIKMGLTHDKPFFCHVSQGLGQGQQREREDWKPCVGAAIWLEQNVQGGLMSNASFRLYLMSDLSYWDDMETNLELEEF